MHSPRIVAAAFFDDRQGRVVVAGQVLDDVSGVEGVDVRVVTELDSVVVRTSSMGAFGAEFAGEFRDIGGPVLVEVVAATVTCQIQ